MARNPDLAQKVTRRQLLRLAAVTASVAASGAVWQACSPAAAPTPVPVAPTPSAPTAAPAAKAPAVATTAPAAAAPTTAAGAPTAAPAAAKPAPVAGMLKAPEPNPKKGGILKISGFGDPAHFDLDQSPSLVNLWPQSPMYENLVRNNPLDGGRTIIPDLAEKWTISPDGLVYTFNLRSGVKFHDGTPLTADDVIATYKRRKDPPTGVVSIRKDLFKLIDKMEAPDPLTVKFTLSSPLPYFLEAIATGWSVILSKKSLEANNFDLRRVQNYPGTGPHRFKAFMPREKWAVERNPNYWNPELPYVDGIERISFTDNTLGGQAVLTGQTHFGDQVSLDTYDEAKKKPDVFGAQLYPATWASTMTFNCTKPPFDNPLVRRAVHLAVSRQDLSAAMAVTRALPDGNRWVHPGSPLSTPREEVLKLPGYRKDKAADIAEAQKLMAAAGLADGVKGLVFLQRGLTGDSIEILSPAFQDLMKRHLKIECEIKPVETSVYWDVVGAGEWHLTQGWPAGAINDPSDYFGQWFKTNGSQNYGKYSNPKFDEVLAKMDKEMDLAKRKTLAREAEDLLDQDAPMYFHTWQQVARIWRQEMKGINHDVIGSYICYRYDTAWLDK